MKDTQTHVPDRSPKDLSEINALVGLETAKSNGKRLRKNTEDMEDSEKEGVVGESD